VILLQAVPVPPTPPAIPVDPNALAHSMSGPTMVLIVFAFLAAVTIVLWPIARALGRRLEGKAAGAELRDELERLRQRLGEVDALQARVAELEERLDFAERLLARGDTPTSLPRGTG
jgi:Tfp pilus assembly protein PilO